MDLLQQVTSLALSKKLKELGVAQNSLCCWGISKAYTTAILCFGKMKYQDDEGNEYFSAFSVAELGELLLGVALNGNPLIIISYKGDPHWYCEPKHGSLNYLPFADTEADVRAKMLVYLIENNLIARYVGLDLRHERG